MTITHVEGDKITFRFGDAGTVWQLAGKKRLRKTLKEWGYHPKENNILHLENTSAKRLCKIRLRLPVEFKGKV